MVSTRFKGFVGTALLVTGAFVFGNAIHESVVAGAYPVTSPAAVIPGVLGGLMIVVGYRLYRPATEYLDVPSDEDQRDGNGGSSGDSELSPVSEEDLEHLESDDERENV